MTSQHALKIGIVGYGIGGIASAIHLRGMGYAIEHFEHSAPGCAVGGAILLQPPALRLIDELGLLPQALARGAPVRRLSAETLSGRRMIDLHYSDHAPGSYGLGIQRRALIEILSAADCGRESVRYSHRMTSVDSEQGILFEVDGTPHGPYDLIIAADGANSPLRRSHPGLVRRDRLYPWAALLCSIDDPENLAGDCLTQVFDGPQHVSAWPIGTLRTGMQPRLNISINVPRLKADAMLQSGEWRMLAAKHYPHFAPLLDQLAQESVPTIYRYRDVELRRSALGRVIFIGDAAHSMSPQLGQGARMALLDASVLALALNRSKVPAIAVHKFERARGSNINRYQRMSRLITPMFQSSDRHLSALRDAMLKALCRSTILEGRMRSILIGD